MIENISFADFNRGGERSYRDVFYAPLSGLISMSRRQLAGIDSIKIDGISVLPGSYCYSLEDGWVSVGVPISDSVEIFYRYSVARDIALSNWDVESYIFYNTGIPFIPGDANDSGSLNGLDVTFLVAYFKGTGSAPPMRLQGDANGSCDVNGLDVVYLVSYFKGGPAPFAGDCD